MSSTTADKLNYLKGTKEAIKNAIVSKGVEVEEDATFRSYAEKIESIEVGDMTKAVYDPTGRNTDIFAYAEGLLGRGMVKSVQSGIISSEELTEYESDFGNQRYKDYTVDSVKPEKSLLFVSSSHIIPYSMNTYFSAGRILNATTIRIYHNTKDFKISQVIWQLIEFY